MRAIIYTKYGPPEVLRVADVEKPEPKDDELRIKVHAAEVTKADCELRSFKFQVSWFWLPLRLALGLTKPKNPILGSYFSGEIDAVGKDVTRFREGDEVFGATRLRLGAYGEYVCVPASYTIIPKPRNMSFEKAAAVPLGGLNALHFMRRAKIQRGEHVLINGAGGSIGIFATQIAKTMGAEVTAVDHTIKERMLRELGVDHFIDYTKEDFTKRGKTYDVIFDMVARKSYTARVRCLNPKGRYLMGNPRLSDMVRSVLTSSFTDKKAVVAFAGEHEEELLALKDMVEADQIYSVVDRVYSMEQAAEAHRRVETEERLGGVIVAIAAD